MVILVLRFARLAAKGALAGAKVTGLLNCHKHPYFHHYTRGAVVCIYLAHIYVNVRDGITAERGITALVSGTELLAHLIGG